MAEVSKKCKTAVIVALYLLFWDISVSAQVTDTLGSITVVGNAKKSASPISKFSPGTRIEKFTDISQLTSGNSLSDFIQKQTALYIKEYGRGMSSYLSMRGTSSTHTSIDWNGQSMLTPTLGQADLSHIPTYFFDNMAIHLGGSSALYGNGSIGGSIQLKTTPQFKEGASGDITLKGGSFTTLFAGSTIRYSHNNWETRAAGYYSYAKNDYKFKNNTKNGHPTERLNNAAYNNYGLLAEVARKFRDNSILQASFMYLNFDRQIQPSVSNNEFETSYHSLYDKNTKLSLQYSGKRGIWQYSASAAYNYDYELYEEDIIAATRFFANFSNQLVHKNLSVNTGAQTEYIKPNVHAYAAGSKEWRSEIYLLMLYRLFKRVEIGGGVRGSFVTGLTIPAQPTANLKYTILSDKQSRNLKTLHNLSVRASVSKSVKVPTMNDRYWGGISTDLKSEHAITYEAGSDYQFRSGEWNLSGFATYYHSMVNDWIRWLPAGEVWRPKNIPKVLSWGTEAGLEVARNIGKYKVQGRSKYSYTNVSMKKSLLKNDPSIGHQLAYQPKHSLFIGAGISCNNFEVNINGHYTGERTSTDINDIMEAYFLLDLVAKYKPRFLGNRIEFSGELGNILNKNYQNVKFYAMPGINFMLGVQVKL